MRKGHPLWVASSPHWAFSQAGTFVQCITCPIVGGGSAVDSRGRASRLPCPRLCEPQSSQGPCFAPGRTQEPSPQAVKAFLDFYPTVGLPDDMAVMLPKSGNSLRPCQSPARSPPSPPHAGQDGGVPRGEGLRDPKPASHHCLPSHRRVLLWGQRGSLTPRETRRGPSQVPGDRAGPLPACHPASYCARVDPTPCTPATVCSPRA